jgi:3'(2'), 5'-bisphosphate nucleotidase
VKWPRFWLVDPLDGIEGFLKRNDEFTLNIALIEETLPVAGAVCLPVQGLLYLGVKGSGCWKIENHLRQPLKISPPSTGEPIRVMLSRSSSSPDTISLIELLPRCVTLRRGSAIKFCAIAAGEADFYPRLDATREWNTAAGQAVVVEAGGVVADAKGETLTYNKPDLTNGPFFVAPSLAWLKEVDVLDYQRRLAEWKFEVPVMSCR